MPQNSSMLVTDHPCAIQPTRTPLASCTHGFAPSASCANAARVLVSAALATVLALTGTGETHAAHAYAAWGQPALAADFAHFAYVNPLAPKGGELRLVSNLRTSNFDKYNPFTMRGSAPAYLEGLLFDSLLVTPLDENGVGYGLLAEDVQVADDRLSVTFRLRREARFHNGDPVLAQDVRYTFDTLTGPHARPGWATLLTDVTAVDVIDDHTVRFRFATPSRELPLTVGGLPIFSHRWGQGKAFSDVVMQPPIGSGPYRIGPVVFGRDITYVRDSHYWAQNLNVRLGQFNFDRVQVKIYRDQTARLEAFKAAEFDLMRVFSAADWARRMTGPRFASGELIKGRFAHQLPTGFQSHVFNTRRKPLDDIRVREALALALDFEWMNRRLFHGSYRRVQGLFGNTLCAAHGLPTSHELQLLQPWRDALPKATFGSAYTPPRTDRIGGDGSSYDDPQRLAADLFGAPRNTSLPHHGMEGGTASTRGQETAALPPGAGLRYNLRRARQLLHEAGWRLDASSNTLRNAQGQPLVLEYLDSSESGLRVITPWIRNLEKIGVRLTPRIVDFALYQQRLQEFDFDIVSLAFGGTHSPGQEYADLFGSTAADTPQSGNFAGVKNPAIDALIARMVGAHKHEDYLAACRALERVISHSHYLVPQWYAPAHHIAYNAAQLRSPAHTPPYFEPESWVILTWWAAPSAKPPSTP